MCRALKLLLFPGGMRGLGITIGLALAIVGFLYTPAALAFPHVKRIGDTTVYSVAPIPDVMADRINRADALLAASPLVVPGLRGTLVLTDGGWRWRVLAAGNWNVIALRRPFSSVLLFNSSDIVADRVRNGAPGGGERTLSGTIAHESVHLLTARRYGEIRLTRMPEWKREGYADYVAQETSIRAEDEARIRERWPDAPGAPILCGPPQGEASAGQRRNVRRRAPVEGLAVRAGLDRRHCRQGRLIMSALGRKRALAAAGEDEARS